MKNILKDPLIYFLLIGFGLFLLFDVVASDDAAYDSRVINVDRDALLFFNVGVEIGQVLFVLLLLVGFFALRAAYLRVSQSAEAGELHWSGLTTPASFVIGSVASYWMIARIAGFWA